MKINDLPENILNYLIKSITIEDTSSLFSFLKNYALEFEEKIELGVYHLVGEEFHFYDGHLSVETDDIKKTIDKTEFLKNKNITYKEFNVFPIFCGGLIKEVCVYKELKQINSFYNDLFIKVLNDIEVYRSIKLENERLFLLSHTDEVTGLYNQRKLSIDLSSTIEEHKVENKNFSLMFIDIDHFKVVNDNYGHLIGSKMLTDIGCLLNKLLRGSDDIYRYGGDEFIVIMRKVNISTVRQIALRILESIKNYDFVLENKNTHKLSVSVGIAEFPTDAKTSKEIIKFADDMMYESKKSGRGKVFHLGQEVSNDSTSS
jgi:diguanylate cyclase (GGDEF)-like protein